MQQSTQRPSSPRMAFTQGRELFLIGAPALALLLAALAAALYFVDPGPPRTVAISTGSESGAYFAFAKQYAAVLARSGVKLDVRPSAGSIENLQRLADPKSGVSIALLQGGIGNGQESPKLNSVGRVFYEPLWVFYRGADIDRLSDLTGKHIAVGPEGSGTRVLAKALLDANKINAGNSTLSPLTAGPAVEALKRGELDAVFLALAPQAPLVQELLRSSDIKLLSFAHADAYTKLFPYLAKLSLPHGVIDLVADVPRRDVTLLAPTAVLVARDDVHPAIVALLAEAAQEVHGKPGLFNTTGEFPTITDPQFPMDQDAVRYYKSGPTFLKRFLPFWVANLVERLIVFLLPALTVAVPLMKAVPWLYRWRIRQRLLYWYKQLREIEGRVAMVGPGGDAAGLRRELDNIDAAISALPVPIQFAEQFYDLRGHVALVRSRLETVPA